MSTDNLKAKIRKAISKAINKLSDTVEIYRPALNEFNDQDGEEFVVVLTGQYYSGSVGLVLTEAGKVVTKAAENFMVVVDDNSMLVKTGDFFVYKGIKYSIVDLGNQLDAYFEFALERV